MDTSLWECSSKGEFDLDNLPGNLEYLTFIGWTLSNRYKSVLLLMINLTQFLVLFCHIFSKEHFLAHILTELEHMSECNKA